MAFEGSSESQGSRFLVFSLCGESYAIPLSKVKEVIAVAPITPIPNSPSHFKGILNLRGLVFSIIDLRLKLRMSRAEMTQETSIIIMDLPNISIGVIVDSVDLVLNVESKDLQPPPKLESQAENGFILGVTRRDDKFIVVLDVEQSLGVEDLHTLRSQNKAPQAA